MIDRTKYTLLLMTLMAMFSMFSTNVIGNTIAKGGESFNTNEAMTIEVIDVNGEVDYLDVVTNEDPKLDFDLEGMPAGTYTVKVSSGSMTLNEVKMSNLSSDNQVITVEVLNEAGDKVYMSEDPAETFNLDEMPKGEYVINIYQGQELINSNKLTQLNELIVK